MSRFSPKGLGMSILAGVLVVADPDNYGENGFPWWVNLLLFATVSVATYVLWYGFFSDCEDVNSEEKVMKKSTQLIVGSISIAILLALVLMLSLR